MIEPAIVVIAYNRPKSLSRLLKSLADGIYPSNNITLHISIDGSDNSEAQQVAESFEWKSGSKIIDVKQENLGLLKHVLECGQLTEKYDSIVVLEDDLLVSPGFYRYAQQANNFYLNDEKIAGVSLFKYPVEENNFYPFQPLQDDSDVHFIQVASSWGQSWNKDQWSKFKTWITVNPNGKEALLPIYILKWGNNSWKKLFINYLLDTDRYFVFPNTSFSTNFEEEGTHATKTGLFQVPMKMGQSQFYFKLWKESTSVYDVYFELIPDRLKSLQPELHEYNLEVDIFGEKGIDSVSTDYILTSKRGKNPVMSFGTEMRPLLQNVLNNINGKEIGLYRKNDLVHSENKRFLKLQTTSHRLEEHAQTRIQIHEQVSVIIPVMGDQLEDLKITLTDLDSDRFYYVTLLIICPETLINQVQRVASSISVDIQIQTVLSSNVDDALQIGIANCSSDYCTWLQPGMTVDLKKLEEVSRVFKGMSQVHSLLGITDDIVEENYIELNTAKYRWTTQRAHANKEKLAEIRTELVFWRKSLLSQSNISKITTGNLFLELLKLTPVYTLAVKVGDVNGVNSSSKLSFEDIKISLEADEFQPKRGLSAALRPIFHYWFQRNVRFFRLFYRETEQLPMVIRYDFKNDSFYLDNY